jgi:hypothetical protein
VLSAQGLFHFSLPFETGETGVSLFFFRETAPQVSATKDFMGCLFHLAFYVKQAF